MPLMLLIALAKMVNMTTFKVNYVKIAQINVIHAHKNLIIVYNAEETMEQELVLLEFLFVPVN
jgi:hypothetical protein